MHDVSAQLSNPIMHPAFFSPDDNRQRLLCCFIDDIRLFFIISDITMLILFTFINLGGLYHRWNNDFNIDIIVEYKIWISVSSKRRHPKRQRCWLFCEKASPARPF